MRHGLDVLHRHEVASCQHRPGLRADHEVLARARPRSPLDTFLDELGHVALLDARRPDKRHRIFHHMVRDRNTAHNLLEIQNLLSGENGIEIDVEHRGRELEDLLFLLLGGIVDVDHEHEPVELRLRKRIGPLLLDGILRPQDKERLLQFVLLSAGGDLQLLHRLQKGGLRLRGRPVDLVRENHVRENRPRDEFEGPLAGSLLLLDDLRARDVRRHEIRRELDSVERKLHALGERPDHERLGETRDADEQRMAA